MIYFKCQQCGEQLEAPTSMSHEVLPCPSCGFQERIPEQVEIILSEDDEMDSSDSPATEPPSDKTQEISAIRQLRISANGEMVLNEDGKSLKCPVQQGKRCESRCAWFALDSEKSIASCQGHLLGQVVQNDYNNGAY
ncbi:MAG: hypothetical protein K9M57_07675 [Phycisphaerae bacterium]|nr:hypothetical protein [Phycisphaerae bacterium]